MQAVKQWLRAVAYRIALPLLRAQVLEMRLDIARVLVQGTGWSVYRTRSKRAAKAQEVSDAEA